MDFVKINNQVELAYDLRGQGETLVFLNGFGGYRQIWTMQMEKFARQYQVLSFDYRGQGDSTGSIATSLKQLASDLKNLLLKLKISHPIFIAHSMGASVVWQFRQLYPDFSIKKIIIVDQTPKMINDDNWNSGFVNLTQETLANHLTMKHKLHETLHGLVPQVMNKLISAQIAHPFDEDKASDLIYDHLASDWRKQIIQEKIPILFVVALQSPYYNDQYATYLKQRNNNIKIAKIPDTGHVVMAEVPDAFNQTLRHFLRQ